ncbi:MAG: cadherin-like domain-containing protein [Colwellia sp.]|nr:cadherin-like domain-containing protein [Colwellia sp.]
MKTKVALAVACALSIVVVNNVSANKPKYDAVHKFRNTVTDYADGTLKSGPQTHIAITEFALKTINDEKLIVNGIEYVLSDTMINHVMEGNSSVDGDDSYLSGLGVLMGSGIPHCDGEEIRDCNNRVIRLLNDVHRELAKPVPDYIRARTLTGEALHTAQDFYSHSNYPHLFNIKKKNSFADLTKVIPSSDLVGSLIADAAEYKTCEWDLGGFFHDDVPTNIFGKRGEEKITTGFFQVNDPIDYKCIHGATGTGINKDDPGNRNFDIAIELSLKETKNFVKKIFFEIAADNTIADPVKVLKRFAGQDERPSLGFIIDTTGSMGSTITGIKSAISQVVADIKADADKDVSDFIVMVYGDPNVGAVTIANDADTVLANINSVLLGIPDGGGDCAELATDGLLKAVRAATNGSELFLYTDADTKNSGLASTIITEAKAKNIVVNFFVSGSCTGATFDSTYSNIATSTGGSVYRYEHDVDGATETFALINPKFSGDLRDSDKIIGKLPLVALNSSRSAAPQKIKKIAQNVERYVSSQGNETYHIVAGTDQQKYIKSIKSSKSAIANTMISHTIDVDNSVTSFTLSIDMSPLGEIKLYRPDGTQAINADVDISIVSSSVSETITVESPSVGQWNIEISGVPESDYELSVKMNSDINFLNFYFAESGGREGHTGLFPISGQPSATKTQYVQAVLAGSIETAELVITALDGNELGRATLTGSVINGEASTFYGELNLPEQDFRVYVVGQDTDGNEYKRLYPNVYYGQVVSVDSVAGEHGPTAGSNYAATFEINNSGVADTFSLSATNTQGYPINVSHNQVSLAEQSKTIVVVEVDIPAGAPDETYLNVILTATSISNPKSANSAIVSTTINGDSDGDGVSDLEEQGKVGVDTSYDGNGDSIPDYQQANVTSMYSTSGSGYLTAEIIGNGTFTKMKAIADPSLEKSEVDDMDFHLGFIDFSIGGLANGETTKLKIYYPKYFTPKKYYKYGPTTANATNHWYDYDNVIFDIGSVTITLTDGLDGDDDLVQNGIIIDAAGIGFPVNTAPVAFNDFINGNYNESIIINVLNNDTDVDGDTLVVTSTSSGSEGKGLVTFSSNNIRYTPKVGFSGIDHFSYVVSDGNGGSDTAIVTVDVDDNNMSSSENTVTTTTTTTTTTTSSGGGSFGVLILFLAGILGLRRKA